MPLDLPHTDLAGQLRGGGAVALQGEGAVQRLGAAAPHTGEGHLLRGTYPMGTGMGRDKVRPSQHRKTPHSSLCSCVFTDMLQAQSRTKLSNDDSIDKY